MKIRLIGALDDGVLLKLNYELLTLLGWRAGDTVHLDVPLTGGGLRVFKDSDPIVHMGGVKEVIRG